MRFTKYVIDIIILHIILKLLFKSSRNKAQEKMFST